MTLAINHECYMSGRKTAGHTDITVKCIRVKGALNAAVPDHDLE